MTPQDVCHLEEKYSHRGWIRGHYGFSAWPWVVLGSLGREKRRYVGRALVSEGSFSFKVLARCHFTCAAQPPVPIPIEAYQYCVFHRHRTIEVAYTSISLCFGGDYCYLEPGRIVTNATYTVSTSDLLAFSLIITLVKNSGAGGSKIPTIMDTIAEDATRYFLVIFTSHFVLVMTLNLGRVSLDGSNSGLPLMLSYPFSFRKRFNLFQHRKSQLTASHITVLIICSVTLVSGNVV